VRVVQIDEPPGWLVPLQRFYSQALATAARVGCVALLVSALVHALSEVSVPQVQLLVSSVCRVPVADGICGPADVL
jgi:hypothetical protein